MLLSLEVFNVLLVVVARTTALTKFVYVGQDHLQSMSRMEWACGLGCIVFSAWSHAVLKLDLINAAFGCEESHHRDIPPKPVLHNVVPHWLGNRI
jgi:hypothetical protein